MDKFCTHLQEYGAAYRRVEASYQALNSLVDRAVAEANAAEMASQLVEAVAVWKREDQALRAKFKELFDAGRILLPKSHGRHARHSHASGHPRGHAKCSDCYREIPRLEYKEWQIAHNGTVNFRGQELPLTVPVRS